MPVPLEPLLERLSREAEEQRAAIRRAAQEEANRLVREAEAGAREELTARLTAREQTLQLELQALLEQMRQQGRRTALEGRHRAVAAILARVEALLPAAVSDPRHVTQLASQLEAAGQLLNAADGVLRVSPALCEPAGRVVPPGTELRPEEGLSGFILQSRDGRVTVDGTLADRFRRLRAPLAIAAARALERAG